MCAAKPADARTQAGEAARGALESLRAAEGEARARRLTAISEEQTRWNARQTDAQGHVAELTRRQEELSVELTAAEQRAADFRKARAPFWMPSPRQRRPATRLRMPAREAESVLAEADKLANGHAERLGGEDIS